MDRALQQVEYALREKSLSDSDRLRIKSYRQDAERLRKDLDMDL
ncbi:hypothetical protein [Marinobacterium aestuariivivens]|uniref:Uncharacterized protein n=1 Tax=Marinobacterium aestuariivivens TaxID=1698799 RepID=A0ABW2A4I4_9GAMM